MTLKEITNQEQLAFDFQATTPCDPQVLNAMDPYWKDFWGNASSRQNLLDVHAAAAVSLARDQLASSLCVSNEKVTFTSGATEANNLALLGHARASAIKLGRAGHLITIATEHHSVLEPLRQLQKEGFRLTELTPSSDGIISIQNLINAFEDDTILVSCMLANNEIGVLQPIAKIAKICRSRGVISHCDAAQAFGHMPINLSNLDIDLLSISAHKIYGPKGVGALINCSATPILPLQWGGTQEQGIRPGTLPVPLIIGFAKAITLALQDLKSRQTRLLKLRNQLLNGLQKQIPEILINGCLENRLPHNLNITIPGIEGIRLHRELRKFVNCSSGSACSNGEPSHVLRSIGRSLKETQASIRLSLGRETTEEDVSKCVQRIVYVINNLK